MKRQLTTLLTVAGLLVFGSAFTATAGDANSSETDFTTVADFELANHRGGKWKLSDVPADHLVVITFLGTECPLAKLYGPRLNQLQTEFGKREVTFVGINSNTQDSLQEITHYVTQHQIKYPILKDVGNRLADKLTAERTPEVIVLDQNRRVRYQGRIDDQYLVGLSRDTVRRRDLAIALEELLAGSEVSTPKTKPIGCHIGRVPESDPIGDITFTKHIAPILNQHCRECHRSGEVAPFSLTSYEDVLGWEDTILEVIADNRMPPWFADPKHGSFSNDARLTQQERDLLQTWVDNGMPEGNAKDLPPAPQYTEGWRIAKPDQVISFDEKPFQVPAEGVVDYKYFTVDPGWKEDKYVVAMEARPDNVAVVHHLIAYVIPPGSDGRRGRDRRMLVGYAPGATPHILDEGTAMKVKAGSKLIFEMHYTPNGTAQEDHSYIGVKFTDKQNVKRLLVGGAAVNTEFTIPAYASDHPVTATFDVRKDYYLLEMTPHMHLRGKSFQYEATYPNGKKEILLNVPGYDFNWQLTYKLKEPKLMPRGTVLTCRATFDNSEQNPVNPKPNKPVQWGDQSWEEMMIGFFTAVAAD
ncbi:MAG: redoxin domain-containing protein [Fuerstiella sp.]